MNILLLMMGGSGTRFGADIPKQFILVEEKPIFSYILNKYDKMDTIDEIIVISHKHWIEHRLLGKGKANRQKSSIHAGLRRDGSQKLTSQKTDYCTITYRF